MKTFISATHNQTFVYPIITMGWVGMYDRGIQDFGGYG
jgi:hypothetical protein